MELKALILTVLVSFFFLIGICIPKFFKKKDKLILFTTSLTFVIMLYLIFFDLLPEIIEILDPFHNTKFIFLILIFTLCGLIILKILDFFVPEHSHEHHEKNDNLEEHDSHLFHIGFITSISLIIHNMLEGISIYITGINDLKLGLLMALSVGCHNLPLGIEVSIGLEAKKERKISKISILILLIISSFLGAFLLFLMGKDLNFVVEGILLSMTLGMLLNISLFELLKEMINNKTKKEIQLGFFIGILLALLLFLL